MPPRLGRYAADFVDMRSRRSLRRQAQKRFASSVPVVYDVVTVGGGPVGLALLAALSKSGLSSEDLCTDCYA